MSTDAFLSLPTSFSPRFSELLERRGLSHSEDVQAFLNASRDYLQDPFKMKGMRETVARIKQAVMLKEKILIHGDYDVDGITGAAILAQTLTELGASPRTFLPERKEDGYGVSERAVKEAAQEGVRLFITVDCGITAHEPVRQAVSHGMDVIIIDHHRIPKEGLPQATFILNPLQEDCPYEFKELSAGGLAFKLAQALLGDRAYRFFDLAAISTICDMAPLQEENRILVREGLKQLSERRQIGLKALGEVAKIRAAQVSVGHIGFAFGPRINAAGRMSSPDIALRLLLTSSKKEADSLAKVLDEENKLRQREERQLVKTALNEVENRINFSRDRILVVAGEGWHAGVIGIVAARLVDKYYRPAIVIALEKGTGKGSGRSIKGFNLFEAMASAKDQLVEFGGHAQAAGLVIEERNVEAFRRQINDHARQAYEGSTFEKEISFDLELKLSDLHQPFLRELTLLEPHGIGNPRPVFMSRGLKLHARPVKKYETYHFWVTDGESVFEAAWREGRDVNAAKGRPDWLNETNPFDMKYVIKLGVMDGRETLLLEVKRDYDVLAAAFLAA